MAILSTVSGYTNIGHDIQVVMTGQDGVAITLVNVMSFDWKQETQDITHMRMNGTTLVADLPKTFSGTIELQRGNDALENEFSQIWQDWITQVDYQLGTLVCTVTSSVGGGSFTFLDVSLRLDDGGTWRGDDVTRQRISFRAAGMNG